VLNNSRNTFDGFETPSSTWRMFVATMYVETSATIKIKQNRIKKRVELK
jgi:hypothetical protein